MLSVGIVGAGIRGKLFADALRDQACVEVVGFAEPAAVMAESARAVRGAHGARDLDAELAHPDDLLGRLLLNGTRRSWANRR